MTTQQSELIAEIVALTNASGNINFQRMVRQLTDIIEEQDAEIGKLHDKTLLHQVGAGHYRSERDIHIKESEVFVKEATAKIQAQALEIDCLKAWLKQPIHIFHNEGRLVAELVNDGSGKTHYLSVVPAAGLVVLSADDAHAVKDSVRSNHEWHEEYDEYGGYPDSHLESLNFAAMKILDIVPDKKENEDEREDSNT